MVELFNIAFESLESATFTFANIELSLLDMLIYLTFASILLKFIFKLLD